ncbi:MAG: ABC transporter permease [Cyanobacteria bacterium HKST-UBA06]|nr:ABC transporter permease [Cyanobacteria bacterium HKST-UBA06]
MSMTAPTTNSSPSAIAQQGLARLPASFWWAAAVLAVVLTMALAGLLMGDAAARIDPDAVTQPPSTLHWLGTDEMGRDLFARLSVGAIISLFIGLSTALVAMGIGTAYGTLAALCHNSRLENVDMAMMRFIDIMYSLPGLMVVILFSIFLGRSLLSIVLALAFFSWPDTARLIRGQVLALKQEAFVEAFTSLGGHPFRLVWRHFIPNLLSLMILSTTITVPRAILTESTLSFVGLGVAPPLSSWGTMINDGWQMIRMAPHLVLIPSIMLFLTMVALNLMGEALDHTLNPQA